MVNIPTTADFRKDMTDAASSVGAVWISFVFVLFYVLLAVAGVTARTMFLEDRVKLPFPEVELPLIAFFWIGPLIVLLTHAYVLQLLIMLAAKTRAYNRAWKNNRSDDRFQNLLPPILLVRLLAAPPHPDGRAVQILGVIVAWATLVIIPVLTLMFFEAQFLPFHSEATTMWGRAAVLLDLALLWWLWPLASLAKLPQGPFANTAAKFLAVWTGPRLVGMATFSVLVVYMTFLVATFPGEPFAETLRAVPLHETLVGGETEPGRPVRTVFPNRLFLRGLDLIDHKAYDTAAKAAMALPDHSLRDRHLERVVLTEAQLGRMDFVGAHLEGADFNRLRARGAWFDGADLTTAQFDDAELQGASFYKASMVGASLGGAQLQGARIAGADLRAAWMRKADLDGASLAGADLRRAILDDASLTGVSFKEAKLAAASLVGARLDGASFYKAIFWKTDFSRFDPKDRADTVSATDADAECTGADCAETTQLVQRTIERTVPDEWKRSRMLDRLLLPLDSNRVEAWEAESTTKRHAIAMANLPAKDLLKLWTGIACLGRAAPFGVSILVDTYTEDTGWTRPREQKSIEELIKRIESRSCAAKEVLSPDLLLGLADLPAAVAASARGEPVSPSVPPPGKKRAKSL